MPLLEINNLAIDFEVGPQRLRAVDDLSLAIESGETLGLVGESGSGKSVTALSIARLLPSPPARYASGEVRLNGRDVLKMTKSELRKIRGETVSYVFQELGASLNPVLRVGDQIKEALRWHRPGAATNAGVVELLKRVGISAPEIRARAFPHQLSGGMQQRVMIAMALAPRPQLLVADEPTTALDVTIQAQILELLHELRQSLGMSILLISHHLGMVAKVADRIAVCYAGQIVEMAGAREVLLSPRHPYTKALLHSVPRLRAGVPRLTSIPGEVPRLGAFPPGCRFAPRCSLRQSECAQRVPPLAEVEAGHQVRCPLWRQGAETL
jgi:peptide/nickel transport system ATP-binding protein